MLEVLVELGARRLTEEVGTSEVHKEWHADDDCRACTNKTVKIREILKEVFEDFTHMQPMVKSGTRAIFVLRLSCRFQTRNAGRIAKVKSEIMLNTL